MQYTLQTYSHLQLATIFVGVVDEPDDSPKQMKIGRTFIIRVIRVYPRPIF